MFGAVKLTKNVDVDKCKYSGYGTGFDSRETFLFPSGKFDQNVKFLRWYDFFYTCWYQKNDILILGEDPTPGFFAEKKCSINFTVTGRKFCLSLHCNGELVSYFLMIQKLLNSKQMILKL